MALGQMLLRSSGRGAETGLAAAERALSRHTVRAYQGDVQSLLEYAWRCGAGEPAALDLAMLRGWLAEEEAG